MDLFDLIVIGGGPGGYLAAERAAMITFSILPLDSGFVNSRRPESCPVSLTFPGKVL